jgi:hypothetical protein
VNFVGHAVVAGRQREDAPFAFGAMVPDLHRMARAPLLVTDDSLAAGVESHHRADAAFHDSPVFKAWQRAVVDGMAEQGRGARAAAHVAVELAIDGHLLRHGAAGSYDRALAWAAGTVDGAWAHLVDRMRGGEVVAAYSTPDGIASRVVGVMRRRPRLAPITPDADDLAAGVDAVLAAVGDGADDLLDEISRRTA